MTGEQGRAVALPRPFTADDLARRYKGFDTDGDRVITRAEMLAGLRSQYRETLQQLRTLNGVLPAEMRQGLDMVVSHLRGLSENPNVQQQFSHMHTVEQYARWMQQDPSRLVADLRKLGIDKIEQLTPEEVAGLGREFLPTALALRDDPKLADAGRGGRE